MERGNYFGVELSSAPLIQFLRGFLIRFSPAIHPVTGDRIKGVGNRKYSRADIDVFFAQSERVT